MKVLPLIPLLLFPLLLFSQAPDTAKIRKEVDSLIQLNQNLVKAQKFDEAIQKIQQAKEKCVIAFGDESVEYANCLHEQGVVYYYQNKFAEAESLWGQRVLIYKKILDEDHPDYANSLSNLALLYRLMAEYEKAESTALKALNLQEKNLRQEHPKYAFTLNNLGLLYWETGDYEKAELMHLEAKAIREKIFGKEHLDYVGSLNNLANLYASMSNYEKAELMYLEAKAITEKIQGKENPDYARLLNNLGFLYDQVGNYEKAEFLHLEAKAIREKIHGKEHPDYAESLFNLGVVCVHMGNSEKARLFFLESLPVIEKFHGKTHPFYAQNIKNLGITYKNMGNYTKAKSFYLEATSIYEKIQGKESPQYAYSLVDIGTVYRKLGEYNKAEPFYTEAKTIQRTKLGEEHPDYAATLNNLGLLHTSMGNYEKAENFYLETLQIRKKQLGEEHLFYSATLNNLANLYQITNNYTQARPLQLALLKNQQFQIAHAFNFLSENEKEKFIHAKIKPNISQIQSAAIKSPYPDIQHMQYDIALLMKGVQLQAGKSTLAYVLHQRDSSALEFYQSLLSVRRRLAKEYQRPIAERKNMGELKAQEEELEKKLARISAAFRKEEASSGIFLNDVQNALKADEAAIEFVHFDYQDPEPTDSVLYAAAILRPGDEHAHFIPLFEEKQLASLLKNQDEYPEDHKARLYNFSETTKENALYTLIWKLLEPHLEDVKTVYYSPSGLLNRINLGALAYNKTETLADKYQLRSLSSTRLLALPKEEETDKTLDALLCGGVRYDYDSLAIVQSWSELDSFALAYAGSRGFDYTDRSLRGGSWNYLPWTEKESKNIQVLLQKHKYAAELKTGFQPTEEWFKQIGAKSASPRVLHLATHGYFFPDPKKGKEHIDGPAFILSEHPMLRSGLIMAGANRVWKGAAPIPGREDGVLTAYEISQMNLTNTELVVLSACETGLGDIQGSEGVFGLQRAFKMAGARYLIQSLWQVPDRHTQELMTSFYANWLEEKMEIPAAFRAAQREMREKYEAPFYWAGFVLME